MDSEQVRLTFVSVDLLYPPLPRFTGTQLPDLYAAVCKRHNFEVFERQGEEGATFGTKGVRELIIGRDRIHIEENVQIHYDLLQRNFADLVGIACENLGISTLSMPRILLRALWPLSADGEDEAGERLRASAFKVNDDQFGLLRAENIDAVGLFLHLTREEDEHSRLELGPLELGPYLEDSSQLFLELDQHRHETIETPAVLQERLRSVYDYFHGQVVPFVGTLLAK